jgi:NTP pyrophosphatase (non-canonical NTP hydrolase)
MDVKALQARLAAFAAERGWDEMHNPRNLAIALAGEAGMLLDLFRWLTDAQSQGIESEYKREAAAEAIADLILHTLRLADKLDIDVERAVAKKLAENDANYPRPASAHAPPVVVAPVAVPASRPAEKVERVERVEMAEKAEKAERKQAAPPIEDQKAALAPSLVAAPPAPVPPAPAPQEAKPVAEPPKPPADKALPNWLDGILPARLTTARKKPVAPPKAVAEPRTAPEPPRPSEVPKASDAPRASATAQAPEPTAVVEQIEAAPPPAPEPEPPPPAEPPAPERYAHLDTDAAKGFAKALAKRVDSARSDDPLLRELHDEVETLRRTLYSPTPKYSWMGESLKTIRAVLEEAATHSVGDEIRAHDYIAQIDRMLAP